LEEEQEKGFALDNPFFLRVSGRAKSFLRFPVLFLIPPLLSAKLKYVVGRAPEGWGRRGVPQIIFAHMDRQEKTTLRIWAIFHVKTAVRPSRENSRQTDISNSQK